VYSFDVYNYWTELLKKIQEMNYLLTLPRQAEATLATIQAL